ncbi:MAG: hypothetical protein HY257_03765, partial [Chloroflexi bacterium]|nr:hypothetical protein [Chloroflexota bacterium]
TEALFNYYARDLLPYTTLPILRADAAPFDEMENRNAVRDLVRAYPRVWYLALHVPFDDPDARIEKFLDAEGVRIERTNFPGVSTAISLSQFLPALPVLRDRADIARPVNFLFGASLRLVGFDAPAQIESGARAIVKLDWQLDQPVGEDFGASLRVVDNAGAVWGEWDSPPLGNVAGTSTLPAQIILVDAHDLPIALGAVPGTYQLFLSVYRAATGEIIGTEKLSDLAITRPRVALDPAAVRATARVDYTAGAVRIIGADFPTRAVRPGDSIPVSIYFQILQKPRADIPVILQVAQRAFPFIGAWTLRAEARAQLSREVETSDLVRQDFSARIPADTSGEIFLRARVGDSTVELGSVRVAEIARTTIAPTIAHQLSARFGDNIELLGYDLTPTRARAGETIRLILYWRALNPMSTSYTVFAHLLDNHNQIVGQHDSIPASGARPTTSWVAGEVIADEYHLQLNDNALRGNYQIEIGWYDAATRARLPVASRGAETSDHLLLSEIEVP